MKATMEISDPLLRQARQWISGRLVKSPTLVLLTETAAHWPALDALLAAGRVTGVLVHDARVPRCAGSMACPNCGRRIGISAVLPASRSSIRYRWSDEDRG